jgi:hypothetical protein
MHAYIHTVAYTHTYTKYMHTYSHTYMHTYIYIYIYTCTYTYICTYTYTYAYQYAQQGCAGGLDVLMDACRAKAATCLGRMSEALVQGVSAKIIMEIVAAHARADVLYKDHEGKDDDAGVRIRAGERLRLLQRWITVNTVNAPAPCRYLGLHACSGGSFVRTQSAETHYSFCTTSKPSHDSTPQKPEHPSSEFQRCSSWDAANASSSLYNNVVRAQCTDCDVVNGLLEAVRLERVPTPALKSILCDGVWPANLACKHSILGVLSARQRDPEELRYVRYAMVKSFGQQRDGSADAPRQHDDDDAHNASHGMGSLSVIHAAHTTHLNAGAHHDNAHAHHTTYPNADSDSGNSNMSTHETRRRLLHVLLHDACAVAVGYKGTQQRVAFVDPVDTKVALYDVRTGECVALVGRKGDAVGEYTYPSCVAFARNGNVIVSDQRMHRVQVFDSDGMYLYGFGSEGREYGQFKYPEGIAVDRHGDIYVCDSENERVQIFSSLGVFKGVVLMPGTPAYPRDIAIGEHLEHDAHLYVRL